MPQTQMLCIVYILVKKRRQIPRACAGPRLGSRVVSEGPDPQVALAFAFAQNAGLNFEP